MRISLEPVFGERSRLRWEAGAVDNIMDGADRDGSGHLALGPVHRGETEDNTAPLQVKHPGKQVWGGSATSHA